MAKDDTPPPGWLGDLLSRLGIRRLSGTPDEAKLPIPVNHTGSANRDPQLRQALNDLQAMFGKVSTHAGPSWTRNTSYPATDLTPQKILQAQRLADQGYPLTWAEMDEQVRERDAHLGGIADQRAVDVAGKPIRVCRRGDDDLATSLKNLCDEILLGIDGFDEDVESLLHANGIGWSGSEIVYTEDEITFRGPHGKPITIDMVVPRQLETVHPKHFQFDQVTDEPYLWLGSDRVSLPFGKFVFHRGEGNSPLTERRGYMRSCVWLSAAKSWSFSDWIVFIHKYGIPTTALEYDGTIQEYTEFKNLYEDILAALGDGRSAIMPSSAKINPIQSPQGGRSSDPHSAMCDVCDSGMSIRVLGATLTTRIGNVGSFAASTTHADVKHAREKADASKLCSTLRRDLLRPVIALNLFPLAKALGFSPQEILRHVPTMRFRIDHETTAPERATIIGQAVNEWGIEVDEEQIRDEFNLDAVRPGSKALPGKPQPVTSGGSVVGSVEAAREGADAPKEDPPDPPAGKSVKPEKTDEKPAKAMRFDFDPSQPRDPDGKFGPGGGGHGGSGGGGGGGGEPTKPKSKAETKRAEVAERKVARAEKKAAKHKDRETKRIGRETKRRDRDEAKAAKARAREEKRNAKAEHAKAKDERKAARVERKRVREEKKTQNAEKRAARQEARRRLGAPRTANGRIDATKVPGASKHYRVTTSEDPENSYKGRSYLAASVNDQMAEFLSAPARSGGGRRHGTGGLNDHVLTDAMGTAGGRVQDRATFDAVSEKYGRQVTTFQEAFRLLAGEPATHNNKRDWRNFDIETLRACPGFEDVELPQWLHEAAAGQAEHDEMQRQYESEYGAEESQPGEPESGYHKKKSDEDIPF